MKKKNVGIIITIVVILVIIIAVGTFTILFFLTDLFKTEEELFWKYASNNLKIVEVLTSNNEEAQAQWKSNNSYTSKGNLNISITSETGTQEIDLGTSSKYNKSNGSFYSDLTLYNENNEALKMSYINCDDIYAIQCKEIYEPYYIGIRNDNLKEFATKLGLPDETVEQIPEKITLENLETEPVITDEEVQYLVDTYYEVLEASISRDNYSKLDKQIVTINNQNYESNGYKLTISQDDIKKMLVDILTKAKDDVQTISILNKVIQEGEVTEETDLQQTLQELLEDIQDEELDEMTITIYNVAKNITKTQVNVNGEAEITIDMNNSIENKDVFSLYGNVIEDGILGEEIFRFTMEKQTLSNMTSYIVNIIIDEYTVTMTTSIGSIVNNKIENNSKVTIVNDDTTIETSYYKTIQQATEEPEIEQLTNSTAVIVNNYPIEQLETFFEGIGEKAEEVLPEKLEELNINLTEDESIYLIGGILSSFVTIVNTNGVNQAVIAVGITTVTLVNQVMISEYGIINKASSSLETNETNAIKETMYLAQVSAEMDLASGKDLSNIENLKESIEYVFSNDYTVTNWENVSFNSTTRKIEGSIIVTKNSKSYLVDFTNETVTEQDK